MNKEQVGKIVEFLVAALVLAAVGWIPELESVQVELITVLGILAMGLIFGVPLLQILAQLLPSFKAMAEKTPGKTDDQLVALVEVILREFGKANQSVTVSEFPQTVPIAAAPGQTLEVPLPVGVDIPTAQEQIQLVLSRLLPPPVTPNG